MKRLFMLLPMAIANAQNPVSTVKQTLDVGIIVSDLEKSKAFYGGVLGLKETSPLAMPDGSTMTRYQAGSAILKVRAAAKAAKYPGGTRTAIGFRLLTLYFHDLAPVVERWRAAGNAEPKWSEGLTKGSKYGFVTDPDGNQIEIVGMPPDVDVAALDRIAVGLTVSNTERSSEFYGKILGLKEDSQIPLPGGSTE